MYYSLNCVSSLLRVLFFIDVHACALHSPICTASPINKAHQMETSCYNYGEKSGLNEKENIKDTRQHLMLLRFLVLNGA